ncbi:MAG: Serine/threonine phosphatase stp [Firmicutes bacterium ADurb.Bin193]|nr:MAG: Serine/threonine phosphatase stp [Firmicutes bacterium ADurb.Bin193]
MRKYSAKTDVGKTRTNNQDNYYVGDNWCVVADGMGGHNGGEVASKTVIDVIRRALMQRTISPDALLRDAVCSANTAIYDMSVSDPTLVGMGSTVVLCYIEGDEAIIAHVGDSRAYHISSEGMNQVTNDHSIVQELIESGTITPVEAKTHPQKNLITRAVGTDRTIEVDIDRVKFSEGDYLLICTDGLTSFVSDDIIEKVIRENDIDEAASQLVSLANSGGGSDNITVILIEL